MGNSTTRGSASFGTITSDYDALPTQVESAIDELNDDDWDIKSITPITETCFASTILQNNADPLGMGMLKANAGSETVTGTYTAGVLIVAQRWREISDAEAAERQRKKDARRSAEDAILAAEAEEARRNAGPIAYNRIMSLPIERKGASCRIHGCSTARNTIQKEWLRTPVDKWLRAPRFKLNATETELPKRLQPEAHSLQRETPAVGGCFVVSSLPEGSQKRLRG